MASSSALQLPPSDSKPLLTRKKESVLIVEVMSGSDSEYFTADEEDTLTNSTHLEVCLWNMEDFYQFQCRDGTVWLLPRYYNPELDLGTASAVI